MSKMAFVQLASRALSLNLVIWSVGGLVYVPEHLFSLFHYLSFPVRSSGQEYLFRSYLIMVVSHVVLSAGLFIASVWVYKCGPSIEAFLSPPEE